MSATERVSTALAGHQYSGRWARYNTPTAACICHCGAEYDPTALHDHQADELVAVFGAIWEFAEQFARQSGDSPDCTCVSCRALRVIDDRSTLSPRCCPGEGSMAHVRGCVNHPEAVVADIARSDQYAPTFGEPVCSWFRWFAWRPVETVDCGWRWLRPVWKRRIQKHSYLDGGGDFWWQHAVFVNTSPSKRA